MIKKVFLRLLITAVSVFAIMYLIPGIVFSGSILDFAEIVGVLFVVSLIVKPVAKSIPLPFKVVEFGLVSIALDAVALWLLASFLTGFKITSFWFSGVSGTGFIVAPIEVPNFLTVLIAALVLGLTSTVLYWLTK